jgi:5'-3' exonuclease
MRVHLIDGTYELFRAHFGAPPAQARDGREVGATRGLLRSLASLLAQPDVTHVAIAYDHVIESFRNQLYAGYKTSEGVPFELLAQFELAEQASRALGIATYPMIEFEADDGLASLAAQCAARPDVEQVLICSPDKDLAQCVRGERVVCFDRMRMKVMDEAGVVAKFGVGPASIPDWLALVGDSADGFPGVARWGAKSASAVLAHYLHLDRIPDAASAWEVAVRGAPALAQNLSSARDQALLFRTLATLREDALPDARLEHLAWQGPDREALPALADELGDDKIVEIATRAKG